MDLTRLRYTPSIPTSVTVFIMNGCWMLSNALSASIEDGYLALDFCFCGVYIDVVCALTCICWTIFVNLVWIPFGHGVIFFMCLIIFCWELLHLRSSKILASNFLFWWYLSPVLVLRCRQQNIFRQKPMTASHEVLLYGNMAFHKDLLFHGEIYNHIEPWV